MVRIFSLFVCLFSCFFSLSQYNNIWYFGHKAGLDFNSTPVAVLTDSKMDTFEGSATICDTNGNLLFYTNGVTVFNRNHQIMANGNGLLGHISSTQSAIIVPWPGRSELYYIITAGENLNGGRTGYNYSVVDMNEEGGKGAVTIKNQLLQSSATEKITVTTHANGSDWWVITMPNNANRQVVAYLINEKGIQLSPIVSGDGLPGGYMTGCMKVSPNGKKLALTGNDIEVYDFDNNTGRVSNEVKIKDILFDYGVEFSADSRFLYCSDVRSIKQYDVSSYTDEASLEATKVIITPPAYLKQAAGMQLGPDARIYITAPGATTLDIISSPNKKGSACSFIEDAIELKGRRVDFMLPNCIPAFTPPFHIDARVTIIDPCLRTVHFDAITNQTANVQYDWNFMDGSRSSLKSPDKIYNSTPNSFEVNLTIKANLQMGSGFQPQITLVPVTRSVLHTITFNPLPNANAGDDLVVEANLPFKLQGSGGLHYSWAPTTFLNNSSIAAPKATLQKDQVFILTVTDNNGCTDKDSLTIKVYKVFDIYVPNSFTPNADGKNDMLHVLPIGIKLNHFSVFNRWGNLVFSTKDPLKGWNGHYKGQLQPADTYVWIAKGMDETGKLISRKGSFYLMR